MSRESHVQNKSYRGFITPRENLTQQSVNLNKSEYDISKIDISQINMSRSNNMQNKSSDKNSKLDRSTTNFKSTHLNYMPL